MSNELGVWYACAACGSQLLVACAGHGALRCCDQDMPKREPGVAASTAEPIGGQRTGWRLQCVHCGTRALCTRGGTGVASCCGAAMLQKSIPALPAVG